MRRKRRATKEVEDKVFSCRKNGTVEKRLWESRRTKTGLIPPFLGIHLAGTFCLPTLLRFSNLGHTFNLPFSHEPRILSRKSLPCVLSFLRFPSSSPWKSAHFAHLSPPNPRAPRPLRSGLNTSPRPFPPPPLSTPSLPRFLFFFCSVAFNSSRPLRAEWLMAPCWAPVRGRKTEAEEEGKTGGDRLQNSRRIMKSSNATATLNWAPTSELDPYRHP